MCIRSIRVIVKAYKVSYMH